MLHIVNSSGHVVVTTGHLVVLIGQVVLISGHCVETDGQKVAIDGQVVYSQVVVTLGHWVAMAGHVVESQTVVCTGQAVDTVGQVVDCTGQLVWLTGQEVTPPIVTGSRGSLGSWVPLGVAPISIARPLAGTTEAATSSSRLPSTAHRSLPTSSSRPANSRVWAEPEASLELWVKGVAAIQQTSTTPNHNVRGIAGIDELIIGCLP